MNLENIREIALIGSGTMGPGIALSFAAHGYRVRICDLEERALQSARRVLRAGAETLARHGLAQSADVEQIEARVEYTSSLAGAAGPADLIVECITENRSAKRALFSQLDEICKPEAIIASNTSYLNIFELVPESRLSTSIITHWFAPPHILPLVEVVRETSTGDQTVELVLGLLHKIGKTPVLMNKYVPGFAINRLLRIIGREVFFLLDNGYITAEQLDLAVKASIAPRMMLLGVVQRYDFTGLDLSANNLKNESYPEPPIDNAPKSLSALVQQGHLGVKTGKGFYDYGDKSLAAILAERDAGLIEILSGAGWLSAGNKKTGGE